MTHIDDVTPPFPVEGGRRGGDEGPVFEPPDEPPTDVAACNRTAVNDVILLDRWTSVPVEERGFLEFEVAGGAALVYGGVNLSRFVGGLEFEIVTPAGHAAERIPIPFSPMPRGTSTPDSHEGRAEKPESGTWTLRWTRQILLGEASVGFIVHYPCGKLPGGPERG